MLEGAQHSVLEQGEGGGERTKGSGSLGQRRRRKDGTSQGRMPAHFQGLGIFLQGRDSTNGRVVKTSLAPTRIRGSPGQLSFPENTCSDVLPAPLWAQTMGWHVGHCHLGVLGTQARYCCFCSQDQVYSDLEVKSIPVSGFSENKPSS